jgi:hypothetical protein
MMLKILRGGRNSQLGTEAALRSLEWKPGSRIKVFASIPCFTQAVVRDSAGESLAPRKGIPCVGSTTKTEVVPKRRLSQLHTEL